ncbi:MAG: hypothetical protein KGJ90_01860 [Patescibacteria group bacterium]|nr:hypothetical protein [Patescibacteria group bacterium]
MATPIQTAFVQATNATSATSSTAWGSNLTVGSQVFVSIGLSGSTNNPTPTVSSVSLGTDSLSKVIAATSGSGSNMAQGELWARTVATSGQKTLTINVSTAANINAVAGEYSGSLYTLTLDDTAKSATGSSNPSASVSTTTTNAADLIIATVAYSGAGASSGPTGGFVIELQKGEAGSGNGKSATGSESAVLLDQVVSTTGTYSTQITMPGSEFNVALMAAYKQVPQVVQPIPPFYRSRPFKRRLWWFVHWKSRLERPTWIFPQVAPPYTLPPQLFKHKRYATKTVHLRLQAKPHRLSWGGILVLLAPVTRLFHKRTKAVIRQHRSYVVNRRPLWGSVLVLLAPIVRLFHRHNRAIPSQPLRRLRRSRLIISPIIVAITAIPPLWRHVKRKTYVILGHHLRRYRQILPLPQTGPPFTQPPQIYHRWHIKPHKTLAIKHTTTKRPLWGGVLVLLAPVTRLFHRHRPVVAVKHHRPLERLRLIIAPQIAVIVAIPPYLWRRQRIVRAQLHKSKLISRLKSRLITVVITSVITTVRNNPWLKSLGKLMNRQ